MEVPEPLSIRITKDEGPVGFYIHSPICNYAIGWQIVPSAMVTAESFDNGEIAIGFGRPTRDPEPFSSMEVGHPKVLFSGFISYQIDAK